MLKLPARLRMDNVPQVWAQLEDALRAEMVQVGNAAGRSVSLDASGLNDFDSAALSLLLSALRMCGQNGWQLDLLQSPPQLRELARVYGLESLFWADAVAAPAAPALPA
ncbi:STAS domain-containing protein [Roseateles sp. SL47]|jgi:phospholipid transport system transporter-binding protein|uniref:STAS domain-containing protein n=1 Tax=Roseateles sp. SL47 TaxID=2995138 RepID=UPI0022720D0E|nr:STAS domain-containing protein [Roseateles sp. SL47]WAC73247.1 STAS domain-containing protein [Roseateles sp. SL47]